MGHGHALYALVLKLSVVLVLAQVALAGSSSGLSSSSSRAPSEFSSGRASSSSSSLKSSSVSSSVQSSSSTTTTTSHSHKSHSSIAALDASSSSAPQPTPSPSLSPPPDPPAQTAPAPPTDSPAQFPAPTPSSSSSSQVLSSTNSNHRVPIIAGVVAPVALLALAGAAWVLFRRRQRTRDRREWERTHASIADAVRQVASPGPAASMGGAGAARWSDLDGAGMRTYRDAGYTHGDDPFADAGPASPAGGGVHQQPMHSPTFAPRYASPFTAVDDDDGSPARGW
ncbi:hypothetical protein C8R46DRAFT_1345244 [Mycena filopes]|nr:hypothetical protein C8R46DRAFT_1345244 [Mycena filopes]